MLFILCEIHKSNIYFPTSRKLYLFESEAIPQQRIWLLHCAKLHPNHSDSQPVLGVILDQHGCCARQNLPGCHDCTHHYYTLCGHMDVTAQGVLCQGKPSPLTVWAYGCHCPGSFMSRWTIITHCVGILMPLPRVSYVKESYHQSLCGHMDVTAQGLLSQGKPSPLPVWAYGCHCPGSLMSRWAITIHYVGIWMSMPRVSYVKVSHHHSLSRHMDVTVQGLLCQGKPSPLPVRGYGCHCQGCLVLRSVEYCIMNIIILMLEFYHQITAQYVDTWIYPYLFCPGYHNVI